MASKHSGAPAFGLSGQTQGPDRSGSPLTATQDLNRSSQRGVLNRRGTEHEPPPNGRKAQGVCAGDAGCCEGATCTWSFFVSVILVSLAFALITVLPPPRICLGSSSSILESTRAPYQMPWNVFAVTSATGWMILGSPTLLCSREQWPPPP